MVSRTWILCVRAIATIVREATSTEYRHLYRRIDTYFHCQLCLFIASRPSANARAPAARWSSKHLSISNRYINNMVMQNILYRASWWFWKCQWQHLSIRIRQFLHYNIVFLFFHAHAYMALQNEFFTCDTCASTQICVIKSTSIHSLLIIYKLLVPAEDDEFSAQ